ncbi:MAG: hypothetical protein J6X18_02740 [Bacteroidales bacterium]|nr:hypothetical protein [Bacteroidales bacterium]
MGQYYTPIILDNENKSLPKKAWDAPHYNNGLKLLEHSWIDNNFVAVVEHELLNNPQRLVWAGDYAEPESDGENLSTKVDNKPSLYKKNAPHFDINEIHDTYVVNHDKKEFYKRPEYQEDVWTVNPLPLLTSEGNGCGGGDYFGEACEEMVGTWARDTIELTKEHPTEDYTEIFPEFEE